MNHDLRDAFRVLRRAPAFSLTSVLTLALAIGSATAVFSVVDAVVLRGLPYASPERLQTIYESADQNNIRLPSYPTFLDWQARGATVRDVIEGFAYVRGNAVVVDGADDDERDIDAYVTPGFFELMGTRPLLGRTFRPDEETVGAPPVAVISHAFFLKRFGGDPSIVGKIVGIDSIPTTVVGVMPRGFAFPNFGGNGSWVPASVWQPIEVFGATHPALRLRGFHADGRAIVRLRARADSAGAASAMKSIAQGLARDYPAEQAHWTSVVLRGLSDELFGSLWSTLLLIGAAVSLIVLLACANVANLMLVRSSIRARELAVRAALGASAWQLARGLLAEAAVIAIIAGAAGTGLAAILTRVIRPYANQRLPFATSIGIDGRAVLFAVGCSTVTALLVGVLPAIHANRGSLVARLRGGAAGGAAPGDHRARHVLVSLQFALAITVLFGAGLLIQSVRRVSSVPLGYEPSGVADFAISPPAGRYDAPAQAAALYARIIAATRRIPRVEAAAAAGGALLSTKVETDNSGGAGAITALYHPISEDFLKILHVPIVAGRGFTSEDMRSPSGLLVTETLAKQLSPAGSAGAVGQRITIYRQSQVRADFGKPITLPVIGVVADYRELGPEQPPPAQVFLPYTLEVWAWMHFIVRAPQPTTILAALTTTAKDIDPAIKFLGKPTVMETRAGRDFADPRVFVAALMAAFACAALLVAAIGLYGIVAYGVAQRTREIGIRIAIGATSGRVVQLVLQHAAVLVAGGLVVGLLAAAAAARLLRSMLFETTATDLTTFVVVPLVLALVAIVASVIPAYRAAKIDPMTAIRAD